LALFVFNLEAAWKSGSSIFLMPVSRARLVDSERRFRGSLLGVRGDTIGWCGVYFRIKVVIAVIAGITLYSAGRSQESMTGFRSGLNYLGRISTVSFSSLSFRLACHQCQLSYHRQQPLRSSALAGAGYSGKYRRCSCACVCGDADFKLAARLKPSSKET
jgi:hypothetical protein